MSQLNTPYPATTYLKGYLDRFICADDKVEQVDLSIALALAIFSRSGLERIFPGTLRKAVAPYLGIIDSVISFLQGKDPSLGPLFARRGRLPEGPHFQKVMAELSVLDSPNASALEIFFGALGVQDQAQFFCTLVLDDLTLLIQKHVDSRFALSRYGEKLAASAPSFDPIYAALNSKPTAIDEILDVLTEKIARRYQPDIVALSVPFPGNVLGAFRIARGLKRFLPKIRIALGGGYVNTELRHFAKNPERDSRVFEFIDAIVYDDGEKPLELLIKHWKSKTGTLLRTLIHENAKTRFENDSSISETSHRDLPAPNPDGLDLNRYLALLEMPNPMHRIWSLCHWNKITLAHGCYWGKCSFCDTSLDYIGRYEASDASRIVDQMESLIKKTNRRGFHFVDEAAPPSLLKRVSEEILKRELVVSWWTNVRFEAKFDSELCELMSRAGCIAVAGGLEVASDRLLKLMKKGVSLKQVREVTKAFTNSGILVHAYLMYGFPTQTEKETVESLERVADLFRHGCIQSAYWHRFSATVHSPIGRNPSEFGITILPEAKIEFAQNDLQFNDSVVRDDEYLGQSLRKALFNYMHGLGLENPASSWFPKRVRSATVSKHSRV